jgi:FRG domain
MAEITAKDWLHLQELLFSDTWDPSIKRHRSSYAYRGLNRSSYTLSTSLMRMGKAYPNMERNLLKQFQKYAEKQLVEDDTDWHWLSLAQHHGLPTRLLDWTYSPYVALHFAVSSIDDFGEDGAVWKVNYAEAHQHLNAIAKNTLSKYGASIFSTDMLAEALAKGVDDLDDLHIPDYDFAVFFEPPAIDDRIVNQFAYFSVLSDPTLAFDDWLATRAPKVRWTKIIVPASIKWEVRDKLDQANLNERTLFGGLDGLCSWLARHYWPRP